MMMIVEKEKEPHNTDLIGICGNIGCGKDTVASVLINEYGFQKLSFAMVLKDVVSVLFDWDRNRVEGLTPEDRVWREQKDEWWSARLGRDWSVRIAMQQIGTDLFRNHFNDDIWVATVEKRLHHYEKAVITDARFFNEIQSIKKMGGEIWRVKRGEDPNWFALAEKFNRANPEQKEQIKMLGLAPEDFGAHESEYAWIGADFDNVIENNRSIDHLECDVRNLAAACGFEPTPNPYSLSQSNS